MLGAFLSILISFFISIVHAQSLRSIAIGESHLIPLSSSQIWLENSKVIKATAQGSHLKIRGISVGTSQLQIGNQIYQFDVYKNETIKLYDKLQNLQSQLVGIQFELANPNIRMTGKIHRWSDWQKISHQYIPGAQLQIDCDVSAQAKSEAFTYLQGELTKHRLPAQVIPIGE